MSFKKPLTSFPDKFFNDLNDGMTYRQMMEEYGLTRYSARQIPEILGDSIGSIEIDNRGTKEYFILGDFDRNDYEGVYLNVDKEAKETNAETVRRNKSSTKQSITKKANDILAVMEDVVKNKPKPEYSYEGNEGGYYTFLLHETDSHFGDHVTSPEGETVYSTDIAAEKLEKTAEQYNKEIAMTLGKDNETELKEIVLLLGGDLVTGEGIYDGQAHEVDETLLGQFEQAVDSYMDLIHSISMWNVPIKVVCVTGNHGNLKISGSSPEANADDLLYSTLERLCKATQVKDIKFVRSDYSDHATFSYHNGKWNGYLTHGENRLEHIGTSSPQSDWLAIKDRYNFDAAWRGHYHMQKMEDVNGALVCMTNSRKPGDDYTDSIAAYGDTGSAVYVATDESPLKEVKVIDV